MITRLYLMPTQQCNCTCKYCYIPVQEKSKTGDDAFFRMVTHQYVDALMKNDLHGEIPQLRFIGGEPYLKFELVQELFDYFFISFPNAMVVVNTNGTLVCSSHIENIDMPKRKNLYHVVSLDGIAEVHNARRTLKNGDGTFESTVNGIRLLQDHGFPVYVNMVLDDFSMQHIAEFMEFLKKELNIHALSVSLRYTPGQTVSVEKNFQLLKKVYEIAEIYNIEVGGHHRLLLGDRIPGLKCQAGVKTFLIASDGTVSACQRFIGRMESPQNFYSRQDFSSLCVQESIHEKCYFRETNALGEKLYTLYKAKYHHYMQVQHFDRVLFGVI